MTTTVRNSFGNTIYRCPDCGFEAWGAPVTYHEMVTGHASMTAIGSHQFDRVTNDWTFVRARGANSGDAAARSRRGLGSPVTREL